MSQFPKVDAPLRSAVKNSTFVFIGMTSSILLWFASKILIVRNTTKEELGIYSLVIAITGILSIIATLGIQEGVSRYVSLFLGEAKREEADSISKTALKLGILSGMFFFLPLFFIPNIIAGSFFYKIELATPIKVMSFFIPCAVIVSILGGILRGHNVIAPRVFILDIGQPLFFLVLLYIFFFLKQPFISIIYAYVLAILIVLILVGIYTFKKTGVNLSLKGSKYGKELIYFSAPLMIATISGIVLTWCDTIMLGRYTTAEDVGVYNVSISLAKLLTFPLSALEFVYMPIAAGMFIMKQHSELNKTYQILTKWNFSATLPVFFILFFYPEITITFLFDERFISSSIPLRILSVGFLFHAFLGTNMVLLIIMGRSKDLMNVSIFGALLNIFLNYVLIKLYGFGIIGSAVATMISYFAINIIVSIMLYRISRIHPITPQYIKPILSSTFIGLIIYAVAKTLPLYMWMLPIYLLLYLGGYFVSLFITRSIEREDMEMFETISSTTGFEMKLIRSFFYKFMS
jgi:O-antigen/teichoic acid export membrane protein